MKIDRLEELNNELSGLLNQQVDDYQKSRLEHIKKIKSQIDMLKNAPPSTDRSDKAHETISKVVQIISIIVLCFNLSFSQAIFNGKKIHQLPTILSTQYDSTWLTIIGNPSTGTLFQLKLDSLLSGSIGSGGGASLDPVAANTLYGNETGVTAYPHSITAAQGRTILGLSTVATSGSYADLSNKPFIPAQPNFTAGSNVIFTGTYPNISISSSGGGSATWGFITGGDPMAQTDLAALFNSKQDFISVGTTSQYYRGDKSWQTLNKTAVGLANVDNVADVLKPLSNDAIFALSQKQDQLISGTNIKKINNIDVIGSGNITIAGTGAQTLDLTLGYGNSTDTNIVFNGTFLLPILSGDILSNGFLLNRFRANGTMGFGIGYNKYLGVNGSYGGENANNPVWFIGTNISSNSANRLDTTMGAWLISMEHNFESTGSLQNEFHIISTSPSGSSVRMLSINPKHDNLSTDNYISGGLRIVPMYDPSVSDSYVQFNVENNPSITNDNTGINVVANNTGYLNLNGLVDNVIRMKRPYGTTGAGSLDDVLKVSNEGSKSQLQLLNPTVAITNGHLVLRSASDPSISGYISENSNVLHLGSLTGYGAPYHNPNVVQIDYNSTGYNEINTGIEVGGALRFNNYSSSSHKWTLGSNSSGFFLNNSTGAIRVLDILADGRVGISQSSPTAMLHLKAGTASTNTAPLKFTSGTNLTTTEAGAIEYDGSHLYFTATNGGTRYQLDQQGGGSSQWTTSSSDIYYNTGKVIIGATSGPQKLSVIGSSTATFIGTDVSTGYTIGRNSGTGALDVLGTQGAPYNILHVNGDIYADGDIYANSIMLLKNWTSHVGIGAGSGTPTASLAIETYNSSIPMLRMGEDASIYYQFKRNASTGYLDIYGSQSTYTGYTFSTPNTSNILVLDNDGRVGIGVSADASAKLDISSTTKGFLPPRMTTTQKNAISSPAEGLIIYDTTLHKLCIYTGSAWETITSL